MRKTCKILKICSFPQRLHCLERQDTPHNHQQIIQIRAGGDSYVLGETNVTSVFPIPDVAPAEIARRVTRSPAVEALNGGSVRFGSKADICSAKRHVRFTPKSGHVRCTSRCPLSANSGHARCHSTVRLGTLLEQAERAAQLVGGRPALIVGHAFGVDVQPQMRRHVPLGVLLRPSTA